MAKAAAEWPYKRAPSRAIGSEATAAPAEVGAAIEAHRARDLRRTLGQFWTPEPLAELMVRWALRDAPGRFVDPGAGPLTFLRAAERAFGAGRSSCVAFELDDDLVRAARAAYPPAICDVRHEDFLGTAARLPGAPVICNPPYTRHHAIRDEVKGRLVEWAGGTFGFRPSRFLGAYGWFLLKAVEVVGPRARLCFVTPIELLASRSGLALFSGLPESLWPRRTVVFGPAFDAFPGVDATAAVTFIDPRARASRRALLVLRAWPGTALLRDWLAADRPPRDVELWGDVLPLEPGLRPATVRRGRRRKGRDVPLRSYATVARGVATGANEFFLFDRQERDDSGIGARHFVPVIARARDAPGLILTRDDLEALAGRGRPTWLLAVGRGERPAGALAERLAEGERLGLAERPLLSRRSPWWTTEARAPASILFTYLSRGNPRFVLNEAGAVALTTFLALRPVPPPEGVTPTDWRTCLVAALNGPGALASLAREARSYGGATRKIEPRELERIEVPAIGDLPAATLRRLAAAAREWLGAASRTRRRRGATRWETTVRGALEAA